jgi:hypothetical protein
MMVKMRTSLVILALDSAKSVLISASFVLLAAKSLLIAESS